MHFEISNLRKVQDVSTVGYIFEMRSSDSKNHDFLVEDLPQVFFLRNHEISENPTRVMKEGARGNRYVSVAQ